MEPTCGWAGRGRERETGGGRGRGGDLNSQSTSRGGADGWVDGWMKGWPCPCHESRPAMPSASPFLSHSRATLPIHNIQHHLLIRLARRPSLRRRRIPAHLRAFSLAPVLLLLIRLLAAWTFHSPPTSSGFSHYSLGSLFACASTTGGSLPFKTRINRAPNSPVIVSRWKLEMAPGRTKANTEPVPYLAPMARRR